MFKGTCSECGCVQCDCNQNSKLIKGESVNNLAVSSTTFETLIPPSGTTANRPDVSINGFPYFDTTLGKPIWKFGLAWVDATGTIVS